MNELSDETIRSFGKTIFQAIGNEQPSAFNKNYWTGRIMEWSMQRPDFKFNMFRLVDVLPSLSSSEAIALHVNEYLSASASDISKVLGWGLNVPPRSLRAKLLAMGVKRSVGQMASQFIAGESPKAALAKLQKTRKSGLAFTVDLLGEFSVSEKEAKAYVDRYLDALEVFGAHIPHWPEASPLVQGHPGELNPICISVKLTALYSQCSPLNFKKSVEVLSEKLTTIARKAKSLGALVYVDAEDSANNPIIYETFTRVFSSEEFKDFPYPGIVVQAYAKESPKLIDDLLAFARGRHSPIAVRLVKGAYWDYETIVSAQNNWPSPLWSKKESSDANYEYLSRVLIDNADICLPAFGSHNVRSLSHACCYAEHKGLRNTQFELQMLYGMAEPISKAFSKRGYLVRLYVPLGKTLPGMGYLVRRLLENTSNESFLRHTFFDASDLDRLLAEPRMKD